MALNFGWDDIMAELVKKLYFRKDAVEQTAKAYSTTAEAGTEYIENKLDGVSCYIATGDITDIRATVGRIKKSSTAAESAILSTGKPPYAEKSWTTPGKYTFTVPAGVARIRIALCGGGGGSGWGTTGGDGNNSAFGELLVATGGGGGRGVMGANTSGRGGVGGTPNGRNGGGSSSVLVSVAGGAGFALSFDLTNGSYGTGGGGWHDRWVSGYLAGGGSGGYISDYVEVVPLKTYEVIVGALGTNRNASSDHNDGVYGGSGGFVLIAFGGDI